MPFKEASAVGVSNSGVDVVVVPPPRSDARHVVTLVTVFNADTAVATPRLFFKKGATKYPLKQFTALAVLADGTYPPRGALVLKALDESLVLNLTAPPATNQLAWTAHWGESS